ncbi:MAG: UvrD-helicase domain-containing protein [Acidimicrobiales bacterium]
MTRAGAVAGTVDVEVVTRRTAQPDDHDARCLVREVLDRTIFATAGAGSGKTTLLVERVCALVVEGRARVDQLAVITFTEAAAAELRERVAEALERAAKTCEDPLAGVRATDALGALDGAAITTLHGFARRILAAYPFEAGLPATFEVLDEARSLAELDEQWQGAVTSLLDDPETARAVQWLVVAGVDVGALRGVLRQLGENWDRIASERAVTARPLPPLDTAAILGDLARALELRQSCTDADDSLLTHLETLGAVAEALEGAGDDALSVLRTLTAPPGSYGAGNKGRMAAWAGRKPEVLALLADAQEARLCLVASAVDAALAHVVAALGDRTLDAARRRRREGRLQYHDLLVLACELVREDRDVRAALHDELRVVLVDEFQDTDPLQAELVCMIAAEPAAAVGRAPWWELKTVPGSLFFVGDPLQSIYGFRRADIAIFRRVHDHVTQEHASLVTNFRSVPGIVEWVNAVFGALVVPGDETLQPLFEPSVPAPAPTPVVVPGATPPAPAHAGSADLDCSVTVLGAGADDASSAQEARGREARELAALLHRAVAEGRPIGRLGRPLQFDDVAVLVPSRRSVPALEAAFDSFELPYRLESSSLVYGAPEVSDLLHVLRAVDDPSDAAAVVAALRTPGFGCGDDDLVRFRVSGGSWDYRTRHRSDLGDDPVRRGLDELRALHDLRAWTGVSELVGRVIEERRQLAAALDDRRWREAWRRLRFVADQARQFAEGAPGGLREYLAWVEIQREEDARVTEVVLPEVDAPAIAVMTVHAAKGLEFPVVAVVGLGGTPPSVRFPAVLTRSGRLEVGVKATRWTQGFPAARAHEELVQENERLRLLYVAVTRAQRHLVVSVHRGTRAARSVAARLEAVLDTAAHLWGPPGDASPEGSVPPPEGTVLPPADTATPPEDARTPEALDRWACARTARLASSRRVVAATSVASLAAPLLEAGGTSARGSAGGAASAPAHIADADRRHEIDADGAGGTSTTEGAGVAALWRRGRGGTAVGRAVHAVLQAVDLATGEPLGSMAATHALHEGVPDRSGEIASMARAALESDTVRQAFAGRHWRELYVGIPIGSRLLEGFVDLVYERPDGLEVVDYKTDKVDGDVDLDDLVQRYRLQGAAYAYAVGKVTGRKVVGCTFLFLRADAAVARRLDDLSTAIDEVLRRMHWASEPELR